MTQEIPPDAKNKGEQMDTELKVDSAVDLAELRRLGRPISVRADALVLDNFKSFPRKSRIPIREGFTTISGPNGSGKSNLIDALQFVLATSSSKGMRADRLTDLISELGNKPTASVALEFVGTFTDPETKLPIERVIQCKRSIRRRKDKSAQVKYHLNGNQIRLCDLHDVLRHMGLPTSGQNFVLQNDVIRLTSMGPVPRRQVLDELAGTKDFDHQINLALKELENADRLGEDTTLILVELKKQLEKLQKERDQALKAQELTSRKQSMEEDLVVLEVTEAEVAVVRAEEEQKNGAKERTKAEKVVATRQGAEVEAGQALAAIEAELAQKGEGDRLVALRSVEAFKARVFNQREKLREVEAEQAAQAQRRPQLEQARDEGLKASARAQQHAARVDEELTKREGELDAINQRLEAATRTLQQEHKDQFDRADQMRTLRKQSELLRTEEQELVEKDRAFADRLSRIEERRALFAEGVSEDTTRQESLKQEAAAASLRFREKRESQTQLEARRRRLIQQVQNLRVGLETYSSKISKSQQSLAAIEARRDQALAVSGGRALEALHRAGLSGIHGTVSKLIDFESEYAEALEATAGGRLNLVVTDNDDVVGRAIEILKRERAGRLSFAPLNRVRGPRTPKLPRGRGIVGFAIDLISTDQRYLDVCREVFGTTLVVEHFDHTKPLIGQFRMVTLEGDIVGRNAIMSGGSRSRRGGLLAAAAEAGKLLTERRRELDDLQKKRDAAAKALVECEVQLDAVRGEIEQERSALGEAEARAAGLNTELNRIEQGLAPRAAQLEALEIEWTEVRAGLETTSPRLAEVRSDLETVELGLGGLDDAAASEAYANLTAQAQRFESERAPLVESLDTLRRSEATALRDQEVSALRLETAEAALAEAIKGASASEARRASLVEALATLEVQLCEQEAALEELSSELAALTRRRDGAREQVQLTHDSTRDATRTLEDLLGRLEAGAAALEALRARAIELRAAALEREIEVPGPEEAPSDLKRERARIQGILSQIDQQLEKLGAVNALAIDQYEMTRTRHSELEERLGVLEHEKTEIRTRIVNLEGRKKTAFLEAFVRVRDAFSKTYYELGRGEGRLILEDPKDPFAGGLQIKVRPRGKKLSRMEVMSGGEKALTALALIFALQEVNPAALFVFDEVDKDLDGVNTKILAEAIRRRAEERQYIVISHHRTMLELSNQTLGVTMRKDFGSVVTGVTVDQSVELTTERAHAAQTELAS
ncbi:MAG: chromosome segregation protein SMC [Planctomycetes bacterium]|nr:chromosome segregation protein SMC [Planctomycetota bacterium]